LDVRYFMQPTKEQVRGVDVMLVVGWPKVDDFVQRRLGAVSYVVCAAPSYWVRISAHRGRCFRLIVDGISAGSWTAFQTDRGRCFSGIVDDGGGAQVIF